MDPSSTAPTNNRKRSNVDDEEDSKPPAKRPRGKRKHQALLTNTSVSLSLDALSLVMEFLSPRQLFHVAFACKTLMGCITPEMVVRSALIHGGNSAKTIAELSKLMDSHALHVPSPLRLLRLVNGKRCEFCKISNVHHVRPHLGVFGCWDCITKGGYTKPWKLTWIRYRDFGDEFDAVFNHPRVATNMCSDKVYMWACPKNLVDGERIGPLATFGDVDKMVEYARNGGSLDTYVTEKLLAPPKEAYIEFNEAYREAEERAERVAKERVAKKAQKRRDAKGNKLAKIEKMASDLAALLGDTCPECLLKKKVLKHPFGVKVARLPLVQFEVAFVDDLMEEYVITPSKLRKKDLKDIATTINEKISLVKNSGFLEVGFLSEDDLFEASIKAHFQEKFSDLERLPMMKCAKRRSASKTTSLVDGTFFSLLEKNQFGIALAYLIQGELHHFLSPDEREDGQNMAEHPEQRQAIRELAETVWMDGLKEAETSAKNDQNFHFPFAMLKQSFQEAKEGLTGLYTWAKERPHKRMYHSMPFNFALHATGIPKSVRFLQNRDYEGIHAAYVNGTLYAGSSSDYRRDVINELRRGYSDSE